MTTEAIEAAAPAVVIHLRGGNVSFIAGSPPVRVITRPTDAVFMGHADYAQRIVAMFADYGVSVTVADVEAAMT